MGAGLSGYFRTYHTREKDRPFSRVLSPSGFWGGRLAEAGFRLRSPTTGTTGSGGALMLR